MIPLCLYGAVVERTNLNVNFSIHKSVVMLSVVEQQILISSDHFWMYLHQQTSGLYLLRDEF